MQRRGLEDFLLKAAPNYACGIPVKLTFVRTRNGRYRVWKKWLSYKINDLFYERFFRRSFQCIFLEKKNRDSCSVTAAELRPLRKSPSCRQILIIFSLASVGTVWKIICAWRTTECSIVEYNCLQRNGVILSYFVLILG